MKKLFLLFILFLVSITFLFTEELPRIEYENLTFGEEKTLEIMSWNIQNFPKSEYTIDYATGIILAVDADVIGLQEIESDSAFVVLLKNLQAQDPEDGWNGFLVPLRDANALARVIGKLIDDPTLREIMGRRSREKAEREFDVRFVVREHLQLYQRLLNNEKK